jgi:D-serine dehydratase
MGIELKFMSQQVSGSTAIVEEEGAQYKGLRPAGGEVALPALTVDEDTYRHNRDTFFALLGAYGARIAPHAKTPMCPEIARDLISAGAWGATVANLQQAEIMLAAGVKTILIANQIGGIASARRLRRLADAYSGAKICCFADSTEAAGAFMEAFSGRDKAPLPVLVEVGAGRTGARTTSQAKEIIDIIMSAPSLTLAGVGTYEGAVTGETPERLDANMAALFALTAETFVLARQASPDEALLLSAGGSAHFDRVINALMPIAKADGNATLLLRSGAIFFSDHGIYRRGFEALDRRALLMLDGKPFIANERFKPAMRLWAEVISVPEPGLAIVGMGMRDVSFDQDQPLPLVLHRDGAALDDDLSSKAKVTKLNDQHAFLAIAGGCAMKIGDIVEFGISHPCTCFDRWRFFYVTDAAGRIAHRYSTYFH